MKQYLVVISRQFCSFQHLMHYAFFALTSKNSENIYNKINILKYLCVTLTVIKGPKLMQIYDIACEGIMTTSDKTKSELMCAKKLHIKSRKSLHVCKHCSSLLYSFTNFIQLYLHSYHLYLFEPIKKIT